MDHQLPPPVAEEAIRECQDFFRMVGFDVSHDDAETILVYTMTRKPATDERIDALAHSLPHGFNETASTTGGLAGARGVLSSN